MAENNEALQLSQVLTPEVVNMQSKFELACMSAKNLQLQDNACAAFSAVVVIRQLRDALTDEVMKQVFLPLMNTTIGFRTDKDSNKLGKDGHPVKPYEVGVVRDCLIDAVSNGLMPTGNQFNIIAGRMYPTKEGYSALLKKIGCKYFLNIGQDQQQAGAPFAEIPCKIFAEYNGEKISFSIVANVKKDSYSSYDQLKGKAERRAKKALYEYLTGCDLGDADEESSAPMDKKAAVVAENANQGGVIGFDEPKPAEQQPSGGWRKASQTQQQTQSGPNF